MYISGLHVGVAQGNLLEGKYSDRGKEPIGSSSRALQNTPIAVRIVHWISDILSRLSNVLSGVPKLALVAEAQGEKNINTNHQTKKQLRKFRKEPSHAPFRK